MIKTSTLVIRGYELDEMTPSIKTARKIVKIHDTTFGYLLDETEQENLFKDFDILKWSNEIEKIKKKIKTKFFMSLMHL